MTSAPHYGKFDASELVTRLSSSKGPSRNHGHLIDGTSSLDGFRARRVQGTAALGLSRSTLGSSGAKPADEIVRRLAIAHSRSDL
jgi:hypothetical protein